VTGEPSSPGLPRALLAALLPRRYRDNQLGDLEEEFRVRGRRDGWRSARRWYWIQAVTSLPGSGLLRYREERAAEGGRARPWMDRSVQDLRYAVRSLAKSPQYASIATFTLALAIGVNTSIFSLVNQILFIELPMEDPQEVYWVWSVNNEARSDITPLSLADFRDYRERARSFESLAALVQDQMILSGVDRPERITVARVTANLFEVWGDQPVLGRAFAPGEDQIGAPRVAVITHSMWENRFGSDPGVLGGTIRLNDRDYSIVGVGSRRLEVGNLGRAALWIPLEMGSSGADRERRTALITGRLAAGVSLAEARAEGARIGDQLAVEHPVTNRGWALQVRTTEDSLLGDNAAAAVTLLVLTVGFVLLIACANVANLVLVRASARVRELAVRSALGAGRARLVRQLLTENLLVAVTAGAIGIGMAYALLRGLVLVTRGREVLFNIATIDQRVLIFTLAVSLATPLLFGLLPAWVAVRADLADSLRSGERGGEGTRVNRAKGALVVTQVAMALSLMLMTGLLVRSEVDAQRVDLGFDSEGVLSMVLQLPDASYDAAAASRFFEQLEDRVRGLPGVRAVALAGGRPGPSLPGGAAFAIEGRGDVAGDDMPTASTVVVTGSYFGVLRIPILRGRAFGDRDGPETAPVAIVNRETAERFWAGGDVLGQRIRLGSDGVGPWRQVVGVVENIAAGSDASNPHVPQIYVPVAQASRTSLVLFARAEGDERVLADPIRRAVWAIDPRQPVDDVRTMSDVVYDLNSVEYALITLFVTFALFALVMAATGVYGVMSFMVSQRRREIGIRLALGAKRASVLRMVMWQGGKLLVIGSLFGLAAGSLLSRLAASLLTSVGPVDPVTYLGVPVILLGTALVANVIPARRATRIDPMTTLRSD
jgi:putative ABC transport system permease protein